ncbi:hypothetical protein [Streptomyces globosus]|uniref:hypothetical protein n=1 Tax=Streptomyces globosus TaxID=68209 RepID=UPI0033737FF9
MELSVMPDYSADPRRAADEAAAPEAAGPTPFGPAGYVRERIEALREAGVAMPNATPVGPEPARLIETVKSWL